MGKNAQTFILLFFLLEVSFFFGSFSSGKTHNRTKGKGKLWYNAQRKVMYVALGQPGEG